MLEINYESQSFPSSGPVINGVQVLRPEWDDLLEAAITVGRPNRQYVFRHGLASMYEAIFRVSLIRMALEQSGPKGKRLRKTMAFKTLDPTEKGAVSYFIGMTMCKLFASKVLGVPWLLHLDVFRPQLNIQLSGRSRPDFVGEITIGGDWITLESKGRVTSPSAQVKNKAKQQARRVTQINGASPKYQIGAVAYFKNDILQFFWRDPEPDQTKSRNAIKLSLGMNAWKHYYKPAFDLVHSQPDMYRQMLEAQVMVYFADLDIEIGIYPSVLKLLADGQWNDARHLCAQSSTELQHAKYQPDGIKVIAGKSWYKPFTDFEGSEHDQSDESDY